MITLGQSETSTHRSLECLDILEVGALVLEVGQGAVEQLDIDQAPVHPALQLLGLHVPQLHVLQT